VLRTPGATVDAIEIGHDPARHRFHAEVDGHACTLGYEVADGRLAILHTHVPAEAGGRGIAAALVRAAFEHARAVGLRVVPRCSYAAAWVERHPGYAALVDPA
jgi:uncharacterized protein